MHHQILTERPEESFPLTSRRKQGGTSIENSMWSRTQHYNNQDNLQFISSLRRRKKKGKKNAVRDHSYLSG